MFPASLSRTHSLSFSFNFLITTISATFPGLFVTTITRPDKVDSQIPTIPTAVQEYPVPHYPIKNLGGRAGGTSWDMVGKRRLWSPYRRSGPPPHDPTIILR